MPTPIRRTRVSVIDELLESPESFDFVQAIRLLERHAFFTAQSGTPGVSALPVAKFSPPAKEAVRFSASHELGFPTEAVGSVHAVTDDKLRHQRWNLLVNFIGMTGSMGVLPFHYSEFILRRLKIKDLSMADFFDLFTHRTVSLFFQASCKYRLPLEYERSVLHADSKTKPCHHTQVLMSILGMGTHGLQRRQSISDASLIFYGGLLSQQQKSPEGLKQIIEDYFGVPAQIEGFVGQWQELIDDVRTRLPWKGNRKGQNVCLGRSCMLGRKGWFAQGKSRIKIGPLDRSQYEKFAPGTGALKALNELTRTYLGLEQDYEFSVEVKRDAIPRNLALSRKNPPLLSWNMWLAGKPSTNTERDELLQIRVSSRKIH